MNPDKALAVAVLDNVKHILGSRFRRTSAVDLPTGADPVRFLFLPRRLRKLVTLFNCFAVLKVALAESVKDPQRAATGRGVKKAPFRGHFFSVRGFDGYYLSSSIGSCSARNCSTAA